MKIYCIIIALYIIYLFMNLFIYPSGLFKVAHLGQSQNRSFQCLLWWPWWSRSQPFGTAWHRCGPKPLGQGSLVIHGVTFFGSRK